MSDSASVLAFATYDKKTLLTPPHLRDTTKSMTDEQIEEHTEEKKYQRCIEDIGNLLQKTSGIFQKMERELSRQTHFTSSQAYLIIDLLRSKELSMQEIGTRMDLEKSSVTRMVKILIRDGYLHRREHESDRRIILISLTEKGHKTALTAKKTREEYYGRIISRLPRGHVREVMKGAEVMFTALEDAL